ncbi:Ig-like domain-containing protein [Flagellimonas zhangzhouensis]|uniref:MG2 domain-containing protein n=1 Tax=Flagellimonas zhangzhouensis TaxID=1073328 RepID=A0A1H2QKI0_9FLAO|nr:Ig-like domain-containing protein [Allomuricauda zhangzhouensis]SDQ54302.1 hypothetical protein SAMN05216294_1616 [Allomuricauda zhangzhouensis]SDW07661.1 hypothetical protein SAMN04487892_0267 [Allomuricauda zhangzhouensis]
MKKQLALFWILLSVASLARAQYVIKDNSELLNLKKLPQEKVYLNHTGPVVFAGEYINYAFYNFNAQNSRLSTISDIGYVALVNEQKEYVLEQKIRLTNAKGQGDFFINTDVPSGNYKLLAYTQWMKNNGLKQVYKDDIVVINPYQVDQGALIGDVSDNQTEALKVQPVDSSMILIQLDKNIHQPREKVVLNIKNYKAKLGHGNYTLKVQQKEAIQAQPVMNAMEFGTTYMGVDGELLKKAGDSLYLPEQRGELLYGTVKNNDGPVANADVVVSIPGEEFLTKFAVTDESGNFYTYLKKQYKTPRAIIQVLNGDKNMVVEQRYASKLDVSGLNFGNFHLKPEYRDEIIGRSVHNQLENQFFSAKPDSVLLGFPIDPFDGGMPETLRLDEYTQFPTFEETLVELFSFAGYRNNGKGNDYIRVAQDFETYDEANNFDPAIVVIDGVFIPNHEAIKEFDARKIETISLVRDQFVLLGKSYQGMLYVKTYDGDFYQNYQPEVGVNVDIKKPLDNKNYYKQFYAENDSLGYGSIPDYRRLLLWEPHVEVKDEELQFEFYTSDLTGEFEVVFDGFTTYGKPISFKKIFVVREENQ